MARIGKRTKKLKACLSMSNASGSEIGNYKHIQINDIESGLRIATISMSHENFGVALSSVMHGEANCEVELYESENYGKTREIKEEVVVVQRKDICRAPAGALQISNRKKIQAKALVSKASFCGFESHPEYLMICTNYGASMTLFYFACIFFWFVTLLGSGE